MTASIEPDVDAYGRETRLEALADLIEVWSVRNGSSPSKDELADYAKDRGWLQRNFVLYPNPSDEDSNDSSLGSQSDRSLELAESVFDVLERRRADLEDSYPFEFHGGRLKPRSSINGASQRYLALLAISFFQGHQHPTSVSLTECIEKVVESTLAANGLKVAATAAHGNKQQNFATALKGIGSRLRLPVQPAAASVSSRAKDAGVDLVGRLDFQDDGIGQWVFVGQVTCGKSETWTAKAREPGLGRWRKLLGLSSNPARFFAVPHEIPEGFRISLCEAADEQLFLLDRRRLIQPERLPLQEEIVLIDLLRSVDVERP